MARLINAEEIISAINNGAICTITFRKPAGPSAVEAATIGKTNENNVAKLQIAAFVEISFIFDDWFMDGLYDNVNVPKQSSVT